MEKIIWFFPLKHIIILVDFLVLNQPCIPGKNIIWSWCIDFLMLCWIWFMNNLFRTLFQSLQWYCSVISLFVLAFSYLGINVILSFKKIRMYSLIFNTRIQYIKNGKQLVFESLVEFPCGPPRHSAFFWSTFLMIFSRSISQPGPPPGKGELTLTGKREAGSEAGRASQLGRQWVWEWYLFVSEQRPCLPGSHCALCPTQSRRSKHICAMNKQRRLGEAWRPSDQQTLMLR